MQIQAHVVKNYSELSLQRPVHLLRLDVSNEANWLYSCVLLWVNSSTALKIDRTFKLRCSDLCSGCSLVHSNLLSSIKWTYKYSRTFLRVFLTRNSYITSTKKYLLSVLLQQKELRFPVLVIVPPLFQDAEIYPVWKIPFLSCSTNVSLTNSKPENLQLTLYFKHNKSVRNILEKRDH